eukprot:TRINITY_DN1933_c0_g1_i2.p2 TRINITY_DN1933_c0_g1~~TRINITY_DN1933_c0_g1_i2.p2  ORF type:complete len:102 (+),score=21.17 TRINITY_DN1933_c0_g1_i2:79-384(+)
MRSRFTLDRGGYGATDHQNDALPEIYYMGIIDILQRYTMAKRGEHVVKSIRYDSNFISSISPPEYATRFIKFITDCVDDTTNAKSKKKKKKKKNDKEKQKL